MYPFIFFQFRERYLIGKNIVERVKKNKIRIRCFSTSKNFVSTTRKIGKGYFVCLYFAINFENFSRSFFIRNLSNIRCRCGCKIGKKYFFIFKIEKFKIKQAAAKCTILARMILFLPFILDRFFNFPISLSPKISFVRLFLQKSTVWEYFYYLKSTSTVASTGLLISSRISFSFPFDKQKVIEISDTGLLIFYWFCTFSYLSSVSKSFNASRIEVYQTHFYQQE